MTKTLIVSSGALLFTILAGIFALAWHGTISGGDALAVVGSIVTALLAILGVHSGVSAGSSAAKTSGGASSVSEPIDKSLFASVKPTLGVTGGKSSSDDL